MEQHHRIKGAHLILHAIYQSHYAVRVSELLQKRKGMCWSVRVYVIFRELIDIFRISTTTSNI